MKIWNIFVGDNGAQLPAFNSQKKPFPPMHGDHGCVAVGWSAVGDMNLYKDNYQDFIQKFRIVYPHSDERAFMTQANRLWKFAYEMVDGDLVICPSSRHETLLVGKIIGDYAPNFHRAPNLPYSNERGDFMHLRHVMWLRSFRKTEPEYNQLKGGGQLTITQSKLNVSEVLTACSLLDPVTGMP